MESELSEIINVTPAKIDDITLNKLRNLEAKIIECKNPLELQKSCSSMHPSASLNKAFVQSGTLGLDLKEDKSLNVSKLSVSQLHKNIPQLNESQIKHYFGSNYSSLSVTQKEKMVYSIINKSEIYEVGMNDVKIEDVLNISKVVQSKDIPQKKMLSMNDTNDAKDLEVIFTLDKNCSGNNQQQSESWLIENSIKIQDERKKEDSFNISFMENMANDQHEPNEGDILNDFNDCDMFKDLNEGNTLKDLDDAIPSNKILCEKKLIGIDSLELSAIPQQCESSLDNKNDEKQISIEPIILEKKSFCKTFLKNIATFPKKHHHKSLNDLSSIPNRKDALSSLLNMKKPIKNVFAIKFNNLIASSNSQIISEQKAPRFKLIKGSIKRFNNVKVSNNKSLNRICNIDQSIVIKAKTPQKLRVRFNTLNTKQKANSIARENKVFQIPENDLNYKQNPEVNNKVQNEILHNNKGKELNFGHEEDDKSTIEQKEENKQLFFKPRKFLVSEIKPIKKILPAESSDNKIGRASCRERVYVLV